MSEETIRRYLAAYNDRDIPAMLAQVTEDVVFENISNTGQSMRLEGREMMGEVAQLAGNAFAWRRQQLLNIIADGNRAAAEVTFEGQAAVDLPNGTQAGEIIRVSGATFFEFREGLICRVADYS